MVDRLDALSSLGFRVRKGYVRPDAEGRLTLGSVARHDAYHLLVNDKGQILLDPVAATPESEAWLWASPTSRTSMERALNQAEDGEFADLGSFAQFANDEE
jgi:hypothetical protein